MALLTWAIPGAVARVLGRAPHRQRDPEKLAARQAVEPLCIRFRGVPQRGMTGVRVRLAQEHHHRTRERDPQRRCVRRGALEPVGEASGERGQQIPAGVGGDGARDPGLRHKIEKPLHKLRAGRVAEDQVVRAMVAKPRTHQIEDRLDHAKGPLLARAGRTGFVDGIAVVVAFVAGKFLLREVRHHEEKMVLVGEPSPVVEIVLPVATDAVHHNDHRRVGAESGGSVMPDRHVMAGLGDIETVPWRRRSGGGVRRQGRGEDAEDGAEKFHAGIAGQAREDS